MSLLTEAKMPSLKDKIEEEAEAVAKEEAKEAKEVKKPKEKAKEAKKKK